MWSPPDPGKGEEGGDQLMLKVGGGEDWKVDGCLLVLGEHPK